MTRKWFLKARVYQEDVETSLFHLVHRNSPPFTHLLHEALPAGVHHAPQRGLPLVPHGEVVPDVDEHAGLQERLCLSQRTRQLRDGELGRGTPDTDTATAVGQAAELEDERLEHQQRGAVVVASWWWMCEIPACDENVRNKEPKKKKEGGGGCRCRCCAI